MMRSEITRIRQLGLRKLGLQIAMAGDTIRGALVRERSFAASKFEMAIGTGHLFEARHREVCWGKSSDIDMTARARIVRDTAKEAVVATDAVILDGCVTADDRPRRPQRSQARDDQRERQQQPADAE